MTLEWMDMVRSCQAKQGRVRIPYRRFLIIRETRQATNFPLKP